MTRLLPSNDYNLVLIMIDQVIKKKHYIPSITDKNNTIAKAIAYLLLKNVWKFHGFFLLFSSD